MAKKSLVFAAALISFAVGGTVWAHEPRLVKESGLILIDRPEISQAFYGELKGREADYLIEFKESGNLTLKLLVPDLPRVEKDKILTVKYAEQLGGEARPFASAFLPAADWQKYYEEYAGDNYFSGPEINQSVEPGYYFIKISSEDNQGKYVLTVGDKEEFLAGAIARTALAWPQLKTGFFEKPAWSVFDGRVGHYAGFGLLGLIVLAFMFYKFNQVYK